MGLIRKKKDKDFSRKLVDVIFEYVTSLPQEERMKFNGRATLCEYSRCVLVEIKGITNYSYNADLKRDIDNCVKLIRNTYDLESMNQENLKLYCDRALDIMHYVTEQVKEDLYHVKANR